MIKSMTGYGQGQVILYDRRFLVEIKSVNHRYNDLTVKLPRILNPFEDLVRKKFAELVFRGKTDVYISFQSFSKSDVKIRFNENISDAYLEQIDEITNRYGYKSEDMLEILVRVPDLITIENNTIDDDGLSQMRETLEIALDKALDKFIEMRENEGQALYNDLIIKSKNILQLTNQMKDRYPFAMAEIKDRIITRINDILEDIEIDETRMMMEIAILSDKASIDEELTRLFSHVNQLDEILHKGGVVGRKLDFLIQEMNREVNTIGSKSNDIEMSKIVIELKSEIEKLREQVQNIE